MESKRPSSSATRDTPLPFASATVPTDTKNTAIIKTEAIAMPLLKPAWSTLAVFSFVSNWNDYFSDPRGLNFASPYAPAQETKILKNTVTPVVNILLKIYLVKGPSEAAWTGKQLLGADSPQDCGRL